MNPDRLIDLLAANSADDPPGSPPCPDEHQVAGYVDGGLDEVARAQFESHLADCGHCQALVGLLCRERKDGRLAPMPGEVAGPGDAHATPQARRPRLWRPAPQWAAAAAVVLAVPLLLQVSRNVDRGEEGQGRPVTPATRTLASTSIAVQVLSPEAGSATPARELSFRWTEVAGSPFYDVRIVTDAGDVVIQQRVTGTAWKLPAQLNLQSGAEYFVHVDAYPSGDKAVSSDHVPFRVAD
jgi:anti-sigma factor RsiW